MAWRTIQFQDGSVRFYSLTDSIETLHDYFMSFWSALTPGYIVLMFTVCIALITIGVIYSVYASIKNGYVTG
jgi:hypothetical protein